MITNELHKTLRLSLFQSGAFYGVSKEVNNEMYNKVKDEINKGLSIIDSACDKFGISIVESKNNSEIDGSCPFGLTLIFSGKLGSQLYSQEDSTKELVVNDQNLLARDLNDLKKSFYSENYLEADRIHKMILSRGIISLEKYLQ